MRKPRLAITLGDPNGIGPELALQAARETSLWEDWTPVLYGPSKVLQATALRLNGKAKLHPIASAEEAQPGRFNVLDTSPGFGAPELGKPTAEAGTAAFEALKAACDDLQAGTVDALCTLPINKQTIQRPDFRFPGHTEYLGMRFGEPNPLMFFVYKEFRLALVTAHIPLRQVADSITAERIQVKLESLVASLQRDFGIVHPRIAVLGLNPHAGDGGLLGAEEGDIISIAIAQAVAHGIAADGPFPADGFFALARQTLFDAVLGMYHDQGLIAFKGLTGGRGVNFTAGLPIVRTSPDHGTAYDIAGKGIADPASFFESIRVAQHVWGLRHALTA